MGFQPSPFCYYTLKLVDDKEQGVANAYASAHTGWPEASPFNHYVNFKECFRDKSAISLLARAGRVEKRHGAGRTDTYESQEEWQTEEGKEEMAPSDLF